VGALVAVGSSNGVVRIFDFDECLAAMHGPSKHTSENEALSPVVSTPPGPAVTDVRWSLMCDNELAVAFAHRSEVYIYDLYRCQNSRAPLRVLQTVRGDSHDAIAAARRQGGNKVLCYLNTPSTEMNAEWLVAGSQSGCIHMWEVSPKIAYSSSVIPVWKISAEMASLRRSAIVGLCPIGKYRLLSASVCGTFAIWDLLNIATRSFGKESAPTLLSRIAHNLSSPLSGITVPSLSGLQSDIGGKLYATLCTGTVRTMQVWCSYSKKENRMQEEWSVQVGDPALVARPLHMRSHSSCEADLSANTAEAEVFHAPSCALMPIGSSVFVTSSYPHNKLDEHWLHVRNTAASTALDDPQRNCPTTPILLRSNEASFTLPGFVVNATPGERAVTVSHDLRSYLCSDLISHSFPSRSSQVLFAWPSDLKAPPACQNIAGLQKLDGVNSHTLELREPYMGPIVRAGVPRVRIRTNLIPSAPKSSESRKTIKSDIFVRAGKTGATVMETHPCLPYIIIGTRADEVYVLTATHDSNVAGAATSSITMEVVSNQNIVRDVAITNSVVQINALPESSTMLNIQTDTSSFVRSVDGDTAARALALAPARTVQLGVALSGYIQNRSIKGTENRVPPRRMSALGKRSKGFTHTSNAVDL